MKHNLLVDRPSFRYDIPTLTVLKKHDHEGYEHVMCEEVRPIRKEQAKKLIKDCKVFYFFNSTFNLINDLYLRGYCLNSDRHNELLQGIEDFENGISPYEHLLNIEEPS